MRWLPKIAVCFFIFTIILSACRLNIGGNGMNEGVLKYNITYLIDETENPIISLMPTFITMRFKQNSVVLEMEGWMGVFKSSFIKNGETNQAVTMLKMMKRKLSYHSPANQGFLGFDAYNQLELRYDDETKLILDFKCKHAEVWVKKTNQKFDIYYTDDIKIDKPNEFTPFEAITGVLMEFQIEINGIPMYLIASEINDIEVSDDVFLVPADYEEVAREELDRIFSSII